MQLEYAGLFIGFEGCVHNPITSFIDIIVNNIMLGHFLYFATFLSLQLLVGVVF